MLEGKYVWMHETAAFLAYETWREPIVVWWKRLVGCNHKHLIVVLDTYTRDSEDDPWVFYATDWYCKACGWHKSVGL